LEAETEEEKGQEEKEDRKVRVRFVVKGLFVCSRAPKNGDLVNKPPASSQFLFSHSGRTNLVLTMPATFAFAFSKANITVSVT
jgi:hypothetical protein